MPKKQYWNKTSAFEHFGVTLENVRWSWSGVSADGGTVALVLWQDAVKREGNSFKYYDDDDLNAEWRSRKGHSARVRHLAYCRDHLHGRFRAVIAKAVELNVDPRQIESCFPQIEVVWQLDSFDEQTGAFVASVASLRA